MRVRVGLVSAAYPPELDGIGDYTWRMADALQRFCDVVVLTSRTEAAPSVGGGVIQAFDLREPAGFKRVVDFAVSEKLDCIVLQYNPFSFGKWGFCPHVPLALRRLRQREPRIRIGIMFHETCVPRWPWKFTVMYIWQAAILRALSAYAHCSFVSTTRWIPQLRRRGAVRCHHLPVGSNIPLCDIARPVAREHLRIPSEQFVVGLFGSMHVSRPVSWVAAACESLQELLPVTMVYVGKDGAKVRDALRGVRVVDAGVQPAELVGLHLRAMDILLSPFTDGISSRRGSVLAALQHGIPVATTVRSWTDELFTENKPGGLLLSSAQDGGAFASDVAAWVTERREARRLPDPDLMTFHDRHFAWSGLAQRMLNILVDEGS